MKASVYEDYKYCMQDISSIYLGAKYTFGEIISNDEILFKLSLVIKKYILPEADKDDTLESHLYYLTQESFLVEIYEQLRARIKVNQIEKNRYVTKVYKIKDLASLSKEEKESKGIVIQELKINKLSLMTF